MPRHTPVRKMSKEMRRQSILKTTSSLVSNYGFWGLTIRDVAEAEHITEAGVLYHFKSKERLLLAVVKYNDEQVDFAIAEELGIVGDVNTSIGLASQFPLDMQELSIATAKVNQDRPEFVRLYTVLQAESLNDQHPAHDFFLNRENRVLHEYSEACARSGASDPDESARQVLAAMDGLQLRWLHDLEGMNFVDEWRKILAVILPEKGTGAE